MVLSTSPSQGFMTQTGPDLYEPAADAAWHPGVCAAGRLPSPSAAQEETVLRPHGNSHPSRSPKKHCTPQGSTGLPRARHTSQRGTVILSSCSPRVQRQAPTHTRRGHFYFQPFSSLLSPSKLSHFCIKIESIKISASFPNNRLT